MRKRRCKYTTVLNVLLGLWTVGVLYGSLAPGDDMPSAGWFDWIPYFDKVVHWGFISVRRFCCCCDSIPKVGTAEL